MQPHSASSAWVVWLETWLGRAPWPAQSAACGPENPSRKLPGCHPSFWSMAAEAPRPEWQPVMIYLVSWPQSCSCSSSAHERSPLGAFNA